MSRLVKFRSIPPFPPVELEALIERTLPNGWLDATTGMTWSAEFWEIAEEGPKLSKAETAAVREAALEQLPPDAA